MCAPRKSWLFTRPLPSSPEGSPKHRGRKESLTAGALGLWFDPEQPRAPSPAARAPVRVGLSEFSYFHEGSSRPSPQVWDRGRERTWGEPWTSGSHPPWRWPLRCSPLACTGDPGQTPPLTLPPGLGLAVSAARYQTGDGDVPDPEGVLGPHPEEPKFPSRPCALGRGPAVRRSAPPVPPVGQRHVALPDRGLPVPAT